MRARRGSRSALLALTLALPGAAQAHGETLKADLKGVTLCTAPASVRVVFEEMVSPQQRQMRPRLERTLQEAMTRRFQAAGVRRRPLASCANADAGVQLIATVRYLNPKTYLGFGDPAYSYDLRLTVTRSGKASPRFVAGHGDLHSESKTGRPFGAEVTRWGAELLDDLAVAWRAANPRTP